MLRGDPGGRVTGPPVKQLSLGIVSTGHPTPVLNGQVRPGDNMYTCSIVALDPETGKMKWSFQPSLVAFVGNRAAILVRGASNEPQPGQNGISPRAAYLVSLPGSMGDSPMNIKSDRARQGHSTKLSGADQEAGDQRDQT